MEMYCISCEEAVPSFFGDFHMYPKWMDIDLPEEMFCEGPFTYCHPPEIEDRWQDNLVEPSPDELERMDLNAKELLLELA